MDPKLLTKSIVKLILLHSKFITPETTRIYPVSTQPKLRERNSQNHVKNSEVESMKKLILISDPDRTMVFFLIVFLLETRAFWAQSQQQRPMNQEANRIERKNADFRRYISLIGKYLKYSDENHEISYTVEKN
jgi:hypothetical protein